MAALKEPLLPCQSTHTASVGVRCKSEIDSSRRHQEVPCSSPPTPLPHPLPWNTCDLFLVLQQWPRTLFDDFFFPAFDQGKLNLQVARNSAECVRFWTNQTERSTLRIGDTWSVDFDGRKCPSELRGMNPHFCKLRGIVRIASVSRRSSGFWWSETLWRFWSKEMSL